MCAIIFVFLLAVVVEGMSRIRRSVVLSARRAHPSLEDLESWNPTKLRLAVTMLHGLQALMGYMLMLATMTFSVELFFAVVLGLATGYAVSFQQGEAIAQQQHVTSNPCCNFMEGEARENQGDFGSTILDGASVEESNEENNDIETTNNENS